MPVGRIDWLPPVRSFRNFFGTYGTTSGSIRGVLNGIMPVAVVDRYRDDEEGSHFAITATALVAAGQHGAFSFGSTTDDWELLSANVSYFFSAGIPQGSVWCTRNLMMYTPDASYQPVVTPSPVGIWIPGLQTDWSFTNGSVVGFTGHNPTLPGIFGSFPFETNNTSRTATPLVSVDFQRNETRFDPPIRVYRDVSLGFVIVETFDRQIDATMTIRYRIRPRTTDGPRTG